LDINANINLPSNINWQNLTFPTWKRYFRFFISIVFACILIVVSFSVVVYSKYSQEKFTEKYNTKLDCRYVPDFLDYNIIISSNKTAEDIPITKAKINCYCKNKTYELGLIEMPTYEVSFQGKSIKPCEEWFNSFLSFQSLQIGIIIVIPLINSAVVILQTLITNFERNKTLTDDLSSNMFKCFVTQFINTAVVILLVNIRVKRIAEANPDFFILTGLYNDLSPEWYANVGSTIAFTMFINIFTPHLSALMFWMYYSCKRCCDSGCDGKKLTSRFTKKNYFLLYVGPHFRMDSRYSQVSIIFLMN
jgi:hypothetical protein